MEISDASLHTSLGATTTTGAYTSNLTSLSPSTTYYTRAYLKDQGGSYTYGSVDSFATLASNTPEIPSSLGPSNRVDGSFTTDTQPALTFTLSDPDVSDTIKYQIQIDDTSDFSSPVVDYTSALAAQGAASFTVGQAAGGGTYATGTEGQTLASNTSYYWRVRAIDNSSVASAYAAANSGSIAFIINQAPGITLGQPTDGAYENGSFTESSGTASDTDGSVFAVHLSIQDTGTSLYYDGSGFNNASEQWLAASTTDSFATWTYALPTLTDTHAYAFRARATDNQAQTTTTAIATITYDATAPSIASLAPADGFIGSVLASITGSSTDAETSIADTAISIKNSLDQYFDGSSFASAIVQWLPVSTTNSFLSWAYGLSSLSDDSYAYQAKATDAAGNQTLSSLVSFIIDTTAPSSAITSPSDSSSASSAADLAISGTGSDNRNLETVEISILNQTTNEYFAGSAWGATQTWLTTTSTDNFATWSFTISKEYLDPSSDYQITSRATDTAGNVQSAASSVSFLTQALSVANENAHKITDHDQRPTHTKTKKTDKGVKITWDDNTDLEDGFIIERKEGEGTYEEIAEVDKNTTSYTDTDELAPGETYTYRVIAFDGDDESDVSDTESITIPEEEESIAASTEEEEGEDEDEDKKDADSKETAAAPIIENPPITYPEPTTFSPAKTLKSIKKKLEDVLGDAVSKIAPDFKRKVDEEGLAPAIAESAVTLASQPASQTVAFAAPAIQTGLMLTQVSFKELLHFIPAILNLGAVTRRRKKANYGIVYDAETGKPLSGVKITLAGADNARPKVLLSNGYGMYAELVPQGSYAMTIEKEGYRFVRKEAAQALRASRGLYDGDLLTFAEPSIINLDIPMEKVTERKASQAMLFFRSHEKNFQAFSSLIFGIGMVAMLILSVAQPTLTHLLLLLAYVLMAALRQIGIGKAAWGEVWLKATKALAPFASVKLYDIFGKLQTRGLTDEYGRYYVFAEQGKHILRVETEDRETHQTVAFEKPLEVKEQVGMVVEKVRV